MDDLSIHSTNWEEHTEFLQLAFEKCRVYQICLNLNNCEFMVRQGEILGHIVFQNNISMDKDKIEVIVDLPRLICTKGVQIFMDHCKYYWRFIIYMYINVASPLYALLVVLEWTEECEQSF